MALLGQSAEPHRGSTNIDRYWSEVLVDAPLGFWPLSGSATPAIERVGDRAMTLRNSPTTGVAGLPRTAGITFNGSTQAADTAGSTQFAYSAGLSWSIELWLKYTTSGTSLQTPLAWRGISASAADEVALITVNNGVAGRIEVNSVNAPVPSRVLVGSDGSWNDGRWHHVVGTALNGGALTLYVDGISRGTPTSSQRSSSGGGTDSRICAGANIASTSTFSQYFAGSISNVAVYGSALSATRVLAHYRAMADNASI
jgi:hypothetical protein